MACCKFIGVNLVKKYNKPSFGFKSIINKIYTYFKRESKILIEIKENYINQNETISLDDIFSKLKNNFFFNQLDQYQEIEQKYEQESRNAIKKVSNIMLFSFGIYFIPIIGDFIGGIFHYPLYNVLNGKIKTTFKINKDLSQSFLSYIKLFGFNKFKENFLLLDRYKEEFKKENLNYILLLIDSILQGIVFFEKM